MSFTLGVPNPGLSQDVQPVITPNAMIILDTSYSMNYKSDGGYPVRLQGDGRCRRISERD